MTPFLAKLTTYVTRWRIAAILVMVAFEVFAQWNIASNPPKPIALYDYKISCFGSADSFRKRPIVIESEEHGRLQTGWRYEYCNKVVQRLKMRTPPLVVYVTEPSNWIYGIEGTEKSDWKDLDNRNKGARWLIYFLIIFVSILVAGVNSGRTESTK